MLSNTGEEDRLYGRGWRFPLTFLPKGGVEMSAGVKNVEQSLKMLFSTQPGERIMRSDYGCDMQSMVFANLSDGTLAALRTRVVESIARYEPRVRVTAVDCEEAPELEGLLRITVSYQLPDQSGARRLSGVVDVRDGRGRGF
ncbi:GPW/gp25 family protein [Burkholderia sp. SIMBA_062]|uniref:GPW/gp25 family protein n=1 Tax=Burkholderia sp. SIMBA_062 TaxID=3085803 RepID=UPI00397DEB17